MEVYELPLVFFTVLGQAAIGILLLVSLLEMIVPATDQGTLKGLRLAGIAVFPLLAVALAASLFHLGTPMGAVRALRNVGSAWLSREIWVFAGLALLSLAYSGLWWKGGSASLRRGLGWLGAALGLVGVWVTAMVYALPARPAWTAGGNTVTFLATALLLGSLVVVSMVQAMGKEEQAAGTVSLVAGLVSLIALVMIATSLASLAIRGNADPQVALSAQATFGTWLFWGRMVLGMVVPAVAAGSVLFRAKTVPAVMSLGLIGALAGELMGRAVFYASAMGPNVWGL